jgi:hypothetical protein
MKWKKCEVYHLRPPTVTVRVYGILLLPFHGTKVTQNYSTNLYLLTVPYDGLRFSFLAQTFKLLPSKHTEASTWHAKPFASMF